MNAMQLQLNNKLIEEKYCSTNNFLHLEENGRSYTLLNGQLNNDNSSYLIENKNKSSFTDTLLQALPSAFSPIQKQQQQQSSPTDITTTTTSLITTTTLDSGNVSATSSVFSSPLNPASANGHTNVRGKL